MAAFTGTPSYANDGIGMPHFALFGTPVNPISTPLVSATAVSPLSYISLVSGSVSIQTINLPWPGFEGDIVFVFTAAGPGVTVTGGSAGAAIALASSPVQFKALTFTYVALTGLWYPSY